jgi:MraZ protein
VVSGVENFVENVENLESDKPTVKKKPALRGNHSSTVDEKGRINIPAKVREAFGESFVIARHLDTDVLCLKIYTETAWERFNTKLQDLSQKQIGIIRRSLDSRDIEIKAGRASIPQSLREYAEIELKEEVVIIGMEDSAELWSKKQYDKNNSADIANAAALMEQYGL